MSVERFNGSFWMLAHVRRRFDLLLNLLFCLATSTWMTAQEVTHCPVKLVENFARSRYRSAVGLRQAPAEKNIASRLWKFVIWRLRRYEHFKHTAPDSNDVILRVRRNLNAIRNGASHLGVGVAAK